MLIKFIIFFNPPGDIADYVPEQPAAVSSFGKWNWYKKSTLGYILFKVYTIKIFGNNNHSSR